MLNRTYLNSLKVSVITEDINRGFSEVNTAANIDKIGEDTLDSNSSWALTSLPLDFEQIISVSSEDYKAVRNSVPSVNKEFSVAMESITKAFSYIESIQSISSPTKLQNVRYSQESKSLEMLRKISKWTNLMNYPWIFYIIRDMLNFYNQITSCYPLNSKDHGTSLEFIPIFNMFRLLYALILYLECDFNDVELVPNGKNPVDLSVKEAFYLLEGKDY